jgi:hypothetical protein
MLYTFGVALLQPFSPVPSARRPRLSFAPGVACSRVTRAAVKPVWQDHTAGHRVARQFERGVRLRIGAWDDACWLMFAPPPVPARARSGSGAGAGLSRDGCSCSTRERPRDRRAPSWASRAVSLVVTARRRLVAGEIGGLPLVLASAHCLAWRGSHVLLQPAGLEIADALVGERVITLAALGAGSAAWHSQDPRAGPRGRRARGGPLGELPGRSSRPPRGACWLCRARGDHVDRGSLALLGWVGCGEVSGARCAMPGRFARCTRRCATRSSPDAHRHRAAVRALCGPAGAGSGSLVLKEAHRLAAGSAHDSGEFRQHPARGRAGDGWA